MRMRSHIPSKALRLLRSRLNRFHQGLDEMTTCTPGISLLSHRQLNERENQIPRAC